MRSWSACSIGSKSGRKSIGSRKSRGCSAIVKIWASNWRAWASKVAELVHVPVLFDEVMAALDLRPNGRYIDCTLGGGGHAQGILERIGPQGRLLGLDRDPHAIAAASERLNMYAERLVVSHRSFAAVGEVARENQFTPVDGILLDMGLSSLQLADTARGFSFQASSPLDMRFDPTQELCAADIVNHWSERELADLIYQ